MGRLHNRLCRTGKDGEWILCITRVDNLDADFPKLIDQNRSALLARLVLQEVEDGRRFTRPEKTRDDIGRYSENRRLVGAHARRDLKVWSQFLPGTVVSPGTHTRHWYDRAGNF